MGRPNEFIPWNKVIKIDEDAIFITPPENRQLYPPFVDQQGWILIGEHFIGRTILDLDGRKIEVVNDVQLLYSKNRMIIIHVDTSFNGFLRRSSGANQGDYHRPGIKCGCTDVFELHNCKENDLCAGFF